MPTRPTPTVTVESVPEATLARAGLDPQLTLSLGIVNNTGRELTVVTRSGLKFTLPSYRSMTDRAVYFREGFAVAADANVALNPTDSPFTETVTTAQRLYNSIKQRMHAGSSTYGRHRDAVTFNSLSLEAIIEAGGTVYVSELDVVVSIHANRAIIHHPFSEDGIKEKVKALELGDASLRLAMYIVDNRHYHGDRYVFFAGTVYRVPARYRPDMRDGFWAVHPVPSSVGGVDVEYRAVHLTLEEAEKTYNLFRTPEEAETFGFSKEAMERENLITKRDTEKRKVEREETKAERDDRLRSEEAETSRRKLALEDRQALRKDLVDIVKFVSTIVVTVTGFCITFIKLKKGGEK